MPTRSPARPTRRPACSASSPPSRRRARNSSWQIDRDKARILNVEIPQIFETLSINLGTAYVNDFNAFGRVYQVQAQADQQFRVNREDILKLKVRSANGALVPLGTLVEIRDVAGPTLVQRYNMYVSVPVQGNAAPGVSSGDALDAMEKIAAETLPSGTSYEWTELALQEKQTGNTAVFIFGLSVLFVFLALAAQYESWTMPFAIILVVPLGVLAALIGVAAPRARQQRARPDRPRRADRARGQERHPDRRVRQAGAGARRNGGRSRGRGLSAAPAGPS